MRHHPVRVEQGEFQQPLHAALGFQDLDELLHLAPLQRAFDGVLRGQKNILRVLPLAFFDQRGVFIRQPLQQPVLR